MVMPKTGKRLIICGLFINLFIIKPTIALEYELNNHTFDLGTRARIAYVNADNKANNLSNTARDMSLLLRFRINSQWTPQLFTLVELDHVELAWQDEFSNGEFFNNTPVIPDAAGIDFNQVLLRYSPTNTLQFTLGREAINLGNERFIGTNSFWQNEQTLDTVGFNYEFGSASKFLYRYIDNANRITGRNAGKKLSSSDSNFAANNGQRPANFLGDHDHDTHLLFAEFKEWDYSKIQVYYFDMNIKDATALSNKTLGSRYEYEGRWNKLRTLAHGELALQQRTEINNDATLQFYDLGMGIGYGTNQLSINYQQLGEHDGTSFVTPLASLHEQNGWVDKFLKTPQSGLRDYSLQYIWRQSPIKIDARYHAFHTDDNHSKLGEELDVDFVLKLSRQGTILLRYADFFSSDNSSPDEQRVFFMYTYNL
jgi:hypothetical protein